MYSSIDYMHTLGHSGYSLSEFKFIRLSPTTDFSIAIQSRCVLCILLEMTHIDC